MGTGNTLAIHLLEPRPLPDDFPGYTMKIKGTIFMKNYSGKKDRLSMRDFFMNLLGPMPLGGGNLP
jgi:hypothetical protein